MVPVIDFFFSVTYLNLSLAEGEDLLSSKIRQFGVLCNRDSKPLTELVCSAVINSN